MDNEPAGQERKYVLSISAKPTSCPISVQLPTEQPVSRRDTEYPICGERKLAQDFSCIAAEIAKTNLSVSTQSTYKELSGTHRTLLSPEFETRASYNLSTNKCPLSQPEPVYLTSWFDDSAEALEVRDTATMQCKGGKPQAGRPYGSLGQKIVSSKPGLHLRDRSSSDIPVMLAGKQSQPVQLAIAPRTSSLQSSAAVSSKNACTLLSTQGPTMDRSGESATLSRKGGQRFAMVYRSTLAEKDRYKPQRIFSDDLERLPELNNHDKTFSRCAIDLTTPETLSLQMPIIKRDSSVAAHHCQVSGGSNEAPIRGQILDLSEETLSPKYLGNRPMHQSVIDAIAHTQSGEWMYKCTENPAVQFEGECRQELQPKTTSYPFRPKTANLPRLSRRWFRVIASERAITWARRQPKCSERAIARDIRKCECAY